VEGDNSGSGDDHPSSTPLEEKHREDTRGDRDRSRKGNDRRPAGELKRDVREDSSECVPSLHLPFTPGDVEDRHFTVPAFGAKEARKGIDEGVPPRVGGIETGTDFRQGKPIATVEILDLNHRGAEMQHILADGGQTLHRYRFVRPRRDQKQVEVLPERAGGIDRRKKHQCRRREEKGEEGEDCRCDESGRSHGHVTTHTSEQAEREPCEEAEEHPDGYLTRRVAAYLFHRLKYDIEPFLELTPDCIELLCLQAG
jgi:hypothetical protein